MATRPTLTAHQSPTVPIQAENSSVPTSLQHYMIPLRTICWRVKLCNCNCNWLILQVSMRPCIPVASIAWGFQARQMKSPVPVMSSAVHVINCGLPSGLWLACVWLWLACVVEKASTHYWPEHSCCARLQQQRTWHSAWTWTERPSCALLQQKHVRCVAVVYAECSVVVVIKWSLYLYNRCCS